MLKGGREGKKHVLEQDKYSLLARSEGMNEHKTRALIGSPNILRY